MAIDFENKRMSALDREQALGYGATITGNDRCVLRGAEIVFGVRQVKVLLDGGVYFERCLSDAVWYLNV